MRLIAGSVDRVDRFGRAVQRMVKLIELHHNDQRGFVPLHAQIAFFIPTGHL